MKITKELAEILGIFAADGSLQDNHICMWGNITEDKEYYDNTICPIFSKVFNIKITAHEKKSNSVYGFYICKRKIIEDFKRIGFTKNKTYTVTIPKIIKRSKNKEIIAAFIRGYADCDGCIDFLKRKGKYKEFKLKYNTYPRIWIVSASHKVIREISEKLDFLEISHKVNKKSSKRKYEAQQLAIIIRGPERVKSFIEKVGFNNPAQQTKYKIWAKFGMCPSKTTIKQRKLILQGELNPFSLVKNGPDRI